MLIGNQCHDSRTTDINLCIVIVLWNMSKLIIYIVILKT